MPYSNSKSCVPKSCLWSLDLIIIITSFSKLASGCPSTIIIIMIVFPKLASGCPAQCPSTSSQQIFSASRHKSFPLAATSQHTSNCSLVLLAPKVLLDYLQPMITNPIQSHSQSLFNHLNRPWVDLQWPPMTYFWLFVTFFDWPTDRPTDPTTHRPTNWPTDRPSPWPLDRLI